MTALQLVPSPAPTTSDTAHETTERHASVFDEKLLFCRLTDTAVTVTNPTFGTAYVSWAAFRMFERIGHERRFYEPDAVRSVKIVELSASVSLAVRVGRDTNGNWLYIDEREHIMFVVSQYANLVLAVYDKRPQTTEPRT